MPSQAEIRCECAFTYMNAVFRKNLTGALAVDVNDVDTASDTGGALTDRRDRARFCRTNATCVWGVSGPRRAERGAKKGAAEWGSLTPTGRSARRRQRRRLETGGTERRRRLEWKPLTSKRIQRRWSSRRRCAL